VEVHVVLWALAACASKDDFTFPMWTGDTGDRAGDTDTDAAGDTDPPFLSDPVTIGFTGSVVTVAGNPFGLDATVRTTPVSGAFTYDLGEGDEEGTDPMRSTFDHQGGTAPFTITAGGRTITGSGNPVVSLNLYGGTTFRWDDGAGALGTPGVDRICAVDGTDDPEISIGLSVTGTGAVVLADDALPDPFPWVGVDLQDDTAITFSVEDAGGTLLMRLETCL
jgi:hypothetical protein